MRPIPVICLNTGDIFASSAEAARFYNLNESNIIKACRGRLLFCGRDEFKKPLLWRHLSVAIQKNLFSNNNRFKLIEQVSLELLEHSQNKILKNREKSKMTFEQEDIYSIASELEKQESEWKEEIYEIMNTLGIDYYPSIADFKKAGKQGLYNTIRLNCGHDLMCDFMGLIEKSEYELREAVFDTMLHCKVNYYPTEAMFKATKRTRVYRKINEQYGHDEFRQRMKLMSKAEYEIKVGNKNA